MMTDSHGHSHSHSHSAPNHPYHLVDPSPWPLVGAIAAGWLAISGVGFMHGWAHATLFMVLLALGWISLYHDRHPIAGLAGVRIPSTTD